ncbi:MAG: DUF6428 family protein [Tepidisphaeraceae bacterium]
MTINLGTSVKVSTLRKLLSANPAAPLHVRLPNGDTVPPHYHVTEVGRVRKEFIDCGGTVRSTERCVLQLWVADDTDHRLDAAKLARIIDLAAPILGDSDLPVEVEYDLGVITQLPVRRVEATPTGLVVHLTGKQTACLAPDLCCPPATPDATAGCC